MSADFWIKKAEAAFFAPAPLRRLAAVRIATGAFLLKQLWNNYDNFAQIARTPVAQWSPVGPLVGWDGPLSPAQFDLWNAVNLLLCLCFLLGLGWRVLSPLFAVSLLYFFSYRTAWGGVLHGDNLATLHVLVLALGPAGGAWSVDAWWAARKGRAEAPEWQVGWNLRLVGLVTTLAYLLAGVAKLVSDPWGWTTGKSLLAQIGNDGLYKDLVSSKGATEWVPTLYQHPGLLLVAAVGTLLLEVGAPLALLDRRLGWLWSVGIWSMHRGIQMIMGIVFPYPLSGVAFVSFFPVEQWVGWIGGRLRGLVGRRVERGAGVD